MAVLNVRQSKMNNSIHPSPLRAGKGERSERTEWSVRNSLCENIIFEYCDKQGEPGHESNRSVSVKGAGWSYGERAGIYI